MSNTTNRWAKLLTGAAKFIPEAGWISIVVELLTQLAASMGVTSGESKEALKHLEALHGELGKVNAAHINLRSLLMEQTELLTTNISHVDAIAAEVQSTRVSINNIEERTTRLEGQSQQLTYLLGGVLLLGAAAVVLLVIVLTRLHR
jgi:DNA repair exonuclease SbcCD ATPase subunit